MADIPAIKGMHRIMREYRNNGIDVVTANKLLADLGYTLRDTDGDGIYYLYPI